MRSLIVLLVSIAFVVIGVAETAAASVASAGAHARPDARAGAAGAVRPGTDRIVCPQAQSTCCGPPVMSSDSRPAALSSKAQVPCCPDAQPTCCPGTESVCCEGAQPSCCPAGQSSCCSGCTAQLTISATPDPARAGQRVTISGHLSAGTAGTHVELWQRLAGQSSYHSIAQTATNSLGEYAFTLGPGVVITNRDWYATASGASSPTLAEGVRALITLSGAGAQAAAGTLVRLSGRVSPADPGATVLIQRRVAGHWRTIARPRTNGRSRYSLGHRFAAPGRVALRAVLAASSRNLRSWSATLVIRVF